jgi:hypothetical protein
MKSPIKLCRIGVALWPGFALIFARPAIAKSSQSQPDVTANGDGSCTVVPAISKLGGSSLKQDIHVGNGEIYHRLGKIGHRMSIAERTYLCKNGHLIRMNDTNLTQRPDHATC